MQVALEAAVGQVQQASTHRTSLGARHVIFVHKVDRGANNILIASLWRLVISSLTTDRSCLLFCFGFRRNCSIINHVSSKYFVFETFSSPLAIKCADPE